MNKPMNKIRKPVPDWLYKPIRNFINKSKWLHFISHWMICSWLDSLKGKKWIYYSPKTWDEWYNNTIKNRSKLVLG